MRRHPTKDHSTIFRLFSAAHAAGGNSEKIDAVGMHLLQRFMLAFKIARPSSVLKLENVTAREPNSNSYVKKRKLLD